MHPGDNQDLPIYPQNIQAYKTKYIPQEHVSVLMTGGRIYWHLKEKGKWHLENMLLLPGSDGFVCIVFLFFFGVFPKWSIRKYNMRPMVGLGVEGEGTNAMFWAWLTGKMKVSLTEMDHSTSLFSVFQLLPKAISDSQGPFPGTSPEHKILKAITAKFWWVPIPSHHKS